MNDKLQALVKQVECEEGCMIRQNLNNATTNNFNFSVFSPTKTKIEEPKKKSSETSKILNLIMGNHSKNNFSSQKDIKLEKISEQNHRIFTNTSEKIRYIYY